MNDISSGAACLFVLLSTVPTVAMQSFNSCPTVVILLLLFFSLLLLLSCSF